MTTRSRGGNRRIPGAHEREGMTLGQAFAVLGLASTAGRDLVHSTYRKLALEHHPDRNPGDAVSLERFKTLAIAHRILQNKFALDDLGPGHRQGECDRCGKYELLRAALDGSYCCLDCLSAANRRRMLPAPPVVIVTCASTIVLLTLAAGCLVAAWSTQTPEYAMASVALGVASLISLAVTCVTIIYTAEPRPPQRRRNMTVTHFRPPSA